MKVKKNDTVVILTGKDNGKTGKVLRAMPSDNKVIVDGINIQKRHKKARSAKETSSIIEQAGPIDASNVLVICPACGKATRVAYKVENGKKVRICKKCGKELDVAKVEEKPAKKATKTTKSSEKTTKTATKTATKAATKKAATEDTAAKTAKTSKKKTTAEEA